MSNLASLNVKIDRTIKKDADYIANAMGMTLSTAINIFVRQMVYEKAIPFKVHVVDNEATRFNKLPEDKSASAAECDFMADDEIDARIQPAVAQTYGKQLLDMLKQKDIPNISLPADENGHAYIDKEKHPDLYDWAVNG